MSTATTSIRLMVPGSREVKYAYVCDAHAREYRREYANWIQAERAVSLGIPCARCAGGSGPITVTLKSRGPQ